MKYFFSLAILISVLNVGKCYGQTYNAYSVCQCPDMIFTAIKETPKFQGSLQGYFEKQLNGKTESFEGTIWVSFVVDTLGQACCKDIQSSTLFNYSEVVKETLNKMPKWISAKLNGHNVCYSTYIKITFLNERVIKVEYRDSKSNSSR